MNKLPWAFDASNLEPVLEIRMRFYKNISQNLKTRNQGFKLSYRFTTWHVCCLKSVDVPSDTGYDTSLT